MNIMEISLFWSPVPNRKNSKKTSMSLRIWLVPENENDI
jgi:hypothetical protein